MINIVVRGKIPPSPVYTDSCGHCGTKFEYNKSDCIISGYYGLDEMIYIHCPLCKTRINRIIKDAQENI